MRACFRTACLLLLAWSGLSAQCNAPEPRWQKSALPKVKIQDIKFEGHRVLPWDIQEQFAADIRNREFTGEDWLFQIKEIVREDWMRHGYFRASVAAEVEVLSGDAQQQEVFVIASIDEGNQYRLGQLRWLHNEPFSAEDLGKRFPLKRGEIFDVLKVREGLELLRKLYGSKGYLNFIGVPGTEIDEEARKITLTLDFDRGDVFRLGTFRILDADEVLKNHILADWELASGSPFDLEYVHQFFDDRQSLFPAGFCIEDHLCRKFDEKRHVVDLVLSFTGFQCDYGEPKDNTSALPTARLQRMARLCDYLDSRQSASLRVNPR